MIARKLVHARRFDEYADIKSLSPIRPVSLPEDFNSAEDDFVREIFAPDPVTHVPCSDLHIVMSKDARPEVAQFIRDKMMQPLGRAVSADEENEDFVLDTVKSRDESVAEYGTRLREIVAKYNKREESKKD